MSTEPTVNPWRKFQGLLPGGGRTVVAITSNNGDGTSSATLRDGTPIRVRGEGVAAPNRALVVEGEIKTQLPTLPQSSVQV